MKRRHLLGVGAAAGLLGLWGLRPADRGSPYNDYFAALNRLLRQEGGGVAQLVIDLDRLDANADLLRRRLEGRLSLRLVTKSLASLGLLDYLGRRLGLQRFMVFQAAHLPALARAFPAGDLLLGKPLPVAAALGFYQQWPADLPFEPATQLTWLVDSVERLRQYADLARALGRRLQVALEIDVGLGRGGFASPETLGAALQAWRQDAPPLRLRGLMGYDAQVSEAPVWVGQADAHAASTARYRAFADVLSLFADLRPPQPLFNGGGSLTYPLHAAGGSPLNEVAVGSALLKPRAFDSEALAAHQPALWIASPVLTLRDGHEPFLESLQPVWQAWDPNRQRALYLDGGRWDAEPVAPAGLQRDALPTRSIDRERLLGSATTALEVEDWVFLRPERSEGSLGEVGELRLLRRGRLVGRWQPLGNA
ncbi:alanine racemase [Pseudomonas mangiferae]|uniref:DSD1 family PLP-dependent enzyme n=1 Tax=Pseudomonas mangiferae TaxID=2593654 RepID=A0A553GZW7_9PSED|nr:alanine racemase [Pseudomonas mangiferae]TRX75044.1 DSD1 family PLP-dependent enzyme [Pseudomonas mangiferae]